MITGAKANWQTIIADLALILFMVTASSVDFEKDSMTDRTADAAASIDHDGVRLPAEGETLAVYRGDPSAPSLAQWLAAQAPDERQSLTIVAHYTEGGRENAIQSAVQLASGAGSQGLRARIVLEPDERTDIFAMLSFDGRENWHADCSSEEMTGGSRPARKDELCD